MGAFTLAIGYAAAEQKNATYTQAKAKGWGVVGSYALSKRTDVYAALKATEVKKKSAATAAYAKSLDNEVFGLGVRHTF
jgi:predicted porin